MTGGYGGCGLDLSRMLYQHNATLYIAGRSEEKANAAIQELKAKYPDSKGSVESMILDLADLTTLKPAVTKFMEKQQNLHVLTLNAGVMIPPAGSKSAQGIDLQLATNCLGSFLLYKLLHPVLMKTASTATPGSVRVTWAGSIVVPMASPKPGGVVFDSATEEPKILDVSTQYAQSKAGNLLLAAVMARKDKEAGIMHLCWNPGNLKTDLARHMGSIQRTLIGPMLYPPVYGAYTELWSALGEIPMEKSGSFVHPWGRIGPSRADIDKACTVDVDQPDGTAQKFVAWCEAKTAPFA